MGVARPFFFLCLGRPRAVRFFRRIGHLTHRIDDDDDADDVVVDATVRDAHGHRTWDERKRSHRARASAASAVRAPTRDWCVNDHRGRRVRARARDFGLVATAWLARRDAREFGVMGDVRAVTDARDA